MRQLPLNAMARDFVAARVNYRQFCVIIVPVIRTDFESDARAISRRLAWRREFHSLVVY